MCRRDFHDLEFFVESLETPGRVQLESSHVVEVGIDQYFVHPVPTEPPEAVVKQGGADALALMIRGNRKTLDESRWSTATGDHVAGWFVSGGHCQADAVRRCGATGVANAGDVQIPVRVECRRVDHGRSEKRSLGTQGPYGHCRSRKVSQSSQPGRIIQSEKSQVLNRMKSGSFECGAGIW